ncbi:VOC family protein [Streptomyces sp. LHD-70]|uniref:VOC family protein n=1 Tax=Streptomyces sp. LHD-70 TaxID=3072140 RepID=UPI00280D2F93|nr:VOC family protein [Streptomyces sp. LHD-70]MDQ8705934.1 VOC family protein [Streptomyces sp. LHD-70]
MASLLNPYLSFDGDARQALEFYKEVFGGELALNTFGDFGGTASGAEADQIMHGRLQTSSGFTLMGADTPPGMEFKPGSNFSVSLSGDDDAELRRYWEKLSADGAVSVPLEKQMWGDVFGMCTDKFGVPWMVDIGEPQS